MNLSKAIFLYLQIGLYFIGGVNHFWHPKTYLKVMPDYIPWHLQLVWLSGLAEIVLAVLLFFPRTRLLGGWGVILLLAAFLPVHIDMLVHAPMRMGSLVVTAPIAWFRLVLQAGLMFLAWYVSH